MKSSVIYDRSTHDSSAEPMESDTAAASQPDLQPRISQRDAGHYRQQQNQAMQAKVARSQILGSEYNTSNPNSGYALVINNTRFESGCLADRRGSENDASNVYQRFNDLGFETDLLMDVKLSAIKRKFREIAERDHSKSDSFFCAILSHGDADGIWATDEKIDLKTIIELVNSTHCPSLIGKPKVFFIQCSRGEEKDEGCKVRMERDRTVSDAGDDEEVQQGGEDIIVVPNDLDFLLVYASVEGKPAYRTSDKGTPFINTLCKELENLADSEGREDIYDILHRVNEGVALGYTNTDGCKQMPCFVSMLRKPFKIGKKT